MRRLRIQRHTLRYRYARIDLPVESRTVINKTVTVNAPPGTTVIYGDATPASAYAGYDCYYDRYNRRRCIPHNPPPRGVYRIEGGSGDIRQSYEGRGYSF
ncbi:hypothetical protein [Kingella potus]|uniref:hypothetical protein n=1 Tax=Kingella potus TaxID=265175 RepID=UPI003CC80E28